MSRFHRRTFLQRTGQIGVGLAVGLGGLGAGPAGPNPPPAPAKRYRCCILGTCCIPWDEKLQFAEAVFRRQVRHLLAGGLRDLYVFGTAGEGYAVTERQFDQITHVFAEETRGPGVQAMVGLISLSLPTVIERIERTRELGLRRFQISLPSWGPLNDGEMATFFGETCGRFPDCEFLHYNLARAQRLLTPGDYARLARQHANLVATKNSTVDVRFLRGLLAEAPQLQHFITEIGFAFAALVQPCGLLVSLSSINLPLARAYFRAGQERDLATLLSMQQELLDINDDLKRVVGAGSPIDGAYDKCYCRLQDPQFPLRLLPPYAGTSDEAFAQFRRLLQEKYPRWLPAES